MKLLTVILNLTAATGYLKNPLAQPDPTSLQQISYGLNAVLLYGVIPTTVLIGIAYVRWFVLEKDPIEKKRLQRILKYLGIALCLLVGSVLISKYLPGMLLQEHL